MLTVAEVVRQHAPGYLQRGGHSVPTEHARVVRSIMACGTGELGIAHYQCIGCGRTHAIGRACGNRHCPSCHATKNANWCEKQLQRLLPCHYFLITFTLPSALRSLARSHSQSVYEAMFRSSSAAMKTLAADPRRLGAEKIGFFGVLHTWGRDLSYHPHIHYVVAGGGLDAAGQWRSTAPNFFLPCEPLSILYRGKMQAAMTDDGLASEIATNGAEDVWRKSWVVDCQPVGDGASAIKYLAPYVFRVAISDRRIVQSTDEEVTFSYRRSGSRRDRRMTLSGDAFIQRLLTHVLPRGFQKVRHYGLLSPNSRTEFGSLQWLIAAALGLLYLLACYQSDTNDSCPQVRCAECGAIMTMVAFETRRPPAPPPPTSRPP